MTTTSSNSRPRRFVEQGRNIRDARRSRGWSQEAFAAMVGTTRRHLIRLENGEHQPSRDLAGRIGEALETDASEFRTTDDDEEPSSMVAALLQQAIDAAVREALRKLTPTPGSRVGGVTPAERAARAKAIRATLEQPTQWGAPAPLPPALPAELKEAT